MCWKLETRYCWHETAAAAVSVMDRWDRFDDFAGFAGSAGFVAAGTGLSQNIDRKLLC